MLREDFEVVLFLYGIIAAEGGSNIGIFIGGPLDTAGKTSRARYGRGLDPRRAIRDDPVHPARPRNTPNRSPSV